MLNYGKEIMVEDKIRNNRQSQPTPVGNPPIILFSLIAVGLIGWIALKDGFGAADISDLAGVAVVMLSLPFFLLGLVALLLLVGLSIGIFKLRGLVPLAGGKLREYLAVGKHYLLLAEDASVKPIFELRGLKAKIDQIGTSRRPVRTKEKTCKPSIRH